MALELLAEGLGFAEGPLWHPDGFLLFSDLVKNEIVKVEGKSVSTYLANSGLDGSPNAFHHEQIGSNALALDKNGDLIFCQHGNHAIAKLNAKGTVELLVDSFNGKRLNSPNDLAISPDGDIFFTDPPYGIKGQQVIPHIAQPVAGVYKLSNGQLELLTDDFQFPNGICFSPDYRYLYVGSNHEGEHVKRYHFRNGKLYDPEVVVAENADGLKTDAEGNLYLATMAGVLSVTSSGEKRFLIETPEMATNFCFHGKEIFITTPQKVYKTILPE